jgi:GNAT superfamily N-acetyltransferase
MTAIRTLGSKDFEPILDVINQAAEAYRGVIPADRWHEPYMSADYLNGEIKAGVAFSGVFDNDAGVSDFETANLLTGVMGIQDVKDVTLIRHAYVLPDRQRAGLGSALIRYLLASAERPVLIGTWAAADWAHRFYEKHGFTMIPRDQVPGLLQKYWNIPARQVETSVVLAGPGWAGP